MIERVERYERESFSRSYPASLILANEQKNREDYMEKMGKGK